ncbi:MAG: pirin family protein [Rhodospirillales bacterium]|nr:pirin family protein [Rhodospirillales bacterium]
MIDIRPFASLGGFRNEWLNARHHFSFGGYMDAARMGFGRLRVWNDDEVAPGTGFDPHPHREMEIITYIREGAITHRDNLGNEGRTEAGDVQVMHAGTGIVHAEYNLEKTPTRLFQIWIRPDRAGAAPGWGTKRFPRAGSGLGILASGREQDRDSGALPLNADAALFAGTLRQGETASLALQAGRGAYLVAASGEITVNGRKLDARDGAAITNEDVIDLTANSDAEVVLVDILL